MLKDARLPLLRAQFLKKGRKWLLFSFWYISGYLSFFPFSLLSFFIPIHSFFYKSFFLIQGHYPCHLQEQHQLDQQTSTTATTVATYTLVSHTGMLRPILLTPWSIKLHSHCTIIAKLSITSHYEHHGYHPMMMMKMTMKMKWILKVEARHHLSKIMQQMLSAGTKHCWTMKLSPRVILIHHVYHHHLSLLLWIRQRHPSYHKWKAGFNLHLFQYQQQQQQQ